MKVWKYIGLIVVLCLRPAGAAPAQTAGSVVETYRLRVVNTMFGRVEMSADQGATYTLVGRVLRPATAATPDRAVKEAGKVARAGRDGLAFGVGPRHILKLRPQWTPKPAAKGKRGSTTLRPQATEPSAMVTDIPTDRGIFGSLVPPAETRVRMQVGSNQAEPIPAHYAPADGDVFVFAVHLLKAGTEEATAKLIEELGKEYAAKAADRARAAKRKVVSGALTLNAKLPEGEPDPIDAVTYMANGELLAAQNTPPFTYTWDTRNVPDGEHVIEIRAFNKTGRMLTRARALVVVQNSPRMP